MDRAVNLDILFFFSFFKFPSLGFKGNALHLSCFPDMGAIQGPEVAGTVFFKLFSF